MVGSCGINRNVWTCRELTLSKCNTLCPWTESGLEPSSLHVSPCWSYFLDPNFDRDAGHDGSKCPVWEKNVDIWSHRSRKLNFERIEHFHPQTRNLKSRHFGLWNGSEHGANTQLFFFLIALLEFLDPPINIITRNTKETQFLRVSLEFVENSFCETWCNIRKWKMVTRNAHTPISTGDNN